ncbi:MAG: type III restriction endonuclease subunit R, partial [Candidatus Eremiobacterota bacterium]
HEGPKLIFPAELLEPWDWSGVDVTKESLWKDGQPRADSIQAKAAERFINGGFDVVFDDDAPGEAADLVCLKREKDHIRLVLVHCKFTTAPAGQRVKDLVEVCSQAVRSGRWLWNFRGLCRHLSTREQRLRSAERSTRFLHGNIREIGPLLQASRFHEVRGEVVVVQPGLSVANQTPDQIKILAAAHSFLKDTVGVSLDVICSV